MGDKWRRRRREAEPWSPYAPPDQPVPEARPRERTSDWEHYEQPRVPYQPGRPSRVITFPRRKHAAPRPHRRAKERAWFALTVLAGMALVALANNGGQTQEQQAQRPAIPEPEVAGPLGLSAGSPLSAALVRDVDEAIGDADAVLVEISSWTIRATTVEDGLVYKFEYDDGQLSDGIQVVAYHTPAFDFSDVDPAAVVAAKRAALVGLGREASWYITISRPELADEPVIVATAVVLPDGGFRVEMSADGELLSREPI
ncbi:hypothetical protein F0U44_11990 [Nocardioides humilatus]|uniref:Uncharacterized protein n=1 Tax=Nocardioides humilatus TaxID=2607660 RepID=A0A5B1LFC4_9ACTN|nr:hypothetical protein [Nocardioides humilatus]KAA1419166.1 hypothetical protein F0U44_11990 [Nocardioides humilatus]